MQSLPWPNFSSVEYVRGVVASLCSSGGNGVHETHIGRIQDIFSRVNLSTQTLKCALDDICLLGEVGHLGNGYWLPTPTRVVPLSDDVSLLTSVAPTSELQRHFTSVRPAGLGRLVSTSQVNHLRVQSFQSWCGAAEPDTATRTRVLIKSLLNEFSPSVARAGLEAFGVKLANGPMNRTNREPAWLSIANRRVLAWNNINLFREKVSASYYRYFLGRLARRGALEEGPSIQDNLSLQYGLASLLGTPLTASVHARSNKIHLRLPLAAPISLRRVLSALCEEDPKSFGYAWVCSIPEVWPSVSNSLQNLGCEIYNYE